MIKPDQLDRLSNVEDFVKFLDELYEVRESLIQQLHDRPEGSVQQIAGRILQLDDVLTMGGWRELEKRRRGE